MLTDTVLEVALSNTSTVPSSTPTATYLLSPLKANEASPQTDKMYHVSL